MSPSNSIISSTKEIGNPSRAVQAVSHLSPVAFHLATPLFVAMYTVSAVIWPNWVVSVTVRNELMTLDGSPASKRPAV